MIRRVFQSAFVHHAGFFSLARTILACAFSLAAAGAANAQSPRIWDVAPQGSDSNPGTERAPFLTIQRAADVVSPGDTVIVEDGVYTGASAACDPDSRVIVCLRRGGTAQAWVTFQARHAGGAKLDGGAGPSTEGFYFKRASYVTISGFEIFGMAPRTGGAHGVMIDLGHDVVLSQLHIHDIGRVCTSTSSGLSAVFVRVPHVTITRSVFHDIGRTLPGDNGCVATTAAHFDHGIYVSGEYYDSETPGTSDLLVTNNIFYRIERGWSVHLYPGTLARINILNNTFAFPNTPRESGQIILAASTSDSRIMNNVFYNPRQQAINYHSGFHEGLRAENNLVFGTSLITTIPPGAAIAGTRVADPLFVNAAREPYDFHLRAGSPAIGAGRSHPSVDLDYDGRRRGARHDAGALGYPADRPSVRDAVVADGR